MTILYTFRGILPRPMLLVQPIKHKSPKSVRVHLHIDFASGLFIWSLGKFHICSPFYRKHDTASLLFYFRFQVNVFLGILAPRALYWYLEGNQKSLLSTLKQFDSILVSFTHDCVCVLALWVRVE